MFKQFCQAFTLHYDHPFECDTLKTDKFPQTDIGGKYASLWNDFVSIRINLFNGKLRQLFENTLNVEKNKINEFYKYFRFYRTLCGILPINTDEDNVPHLHEYDKNPLPVFFKRGLNVTLSTDDPLLIQLSSIFFCLCLLLFYVVWSDPYRIG